MLRPFLIEILLNPNPKKLIHVCALTVAVMLCGCDGGTRITGVVFGPEGRPVAGADVKLTCGASSREVKTAEYGFFKIGMTHSPWNPELTLAVEKPGYKPFQKHFQAAEHLKDIVVTLEPLVEPSQAPEESPATLPPECLITKLESSSFPAFGSFSVQSYKGSPIINFQITESGAVADAKMTRSSGVGEIDRALVTAVSQWKYKPRPGCPVIESEMSIMIHWK
jgi:TonB family protein